MPTLGERLRMRWISAGIAARPGVAPEEIRAFESRYGALLPPDLRDYFSTVDGMEWGKSDEEMLEFFHLGAVKSIPEDVATWPRWRNIVNTLPNPERYFVIADFMLSSHVFAIRLSEAGTEPAPVLGVLNDHYWQSAESFTHFLEQYLEGGAMALM
jgi:hypothetical protein